MTSSYNSTEKLDNGFKKNKWVPSKSKSTISILFSINDSHSLYKKCTSRRGSGSHVITGDNASRVPATAAVAAAAITVSTC